MPTVQTQDQVTVVEVGDESVSVAVELIGSILEGSPGPQGPQGNTGPAGPSNVLSVGTVTTGAAGSSALVNITGTSPSQIINFTIPRGDQGIQGIQGPQGPQGVQGPAGAGSLNSVNGTTNQINSTGGTDPVLSLASAVLTSLGKADTALQSANIGSTVQGYSANLAAWSALATSAKQDSSVNLTSWAALAPSAKQDASAKLTAYAGGDTPSAFTLGIVDSTDATAWRSALGLAIGTNVQAFSSNLAAYAGGSTPSAFTLSIVNAIDAAAFRTAIGAGASSLTLANPGATFGADLTGSNGTAPTAMRSDAVLKIDPSIGPTWTGAHTFTHAAGLLVSNAAPFIRLYETDQAADAKQWYMESAGGTFRLRTASDAFANGHSAFEVTRNVAAVTTVFFGNTTDNPSFTFLGTGTVVVPGAFYLDSATVTIRDIAFRTNGNFRWIIRTDGTSESGSNAGSNFSIRARSDAGADLGASISILRSSMVVDFAVAPTVAGVLYNAPSKLGSGTPTSANFLRGDGAWTNNLNGILVIDTSGSSTGNRNTEFRTAGQSLIGFSSYAGAWRPSITIQGDTSADYMFLVAPSAASDPGYIKMSKHLDIYSGGNFALRIDTNGYVKPQSWIAMSASGTGILNADGYYLFPAGPGNSLWNMQGAASGIAALRLLDGAGAGKVWLYASGNDYGILNGGGSWAWRYDSSLNYWTTAGGVGISADGVITSTSNSGPQINARPASGNAYVRADRASSAAGEVGYRWDTAGSPIWYCYASASSTDMNWYSGSNGTVMTLTATGSLYVTKPIIRLTQGAHLWYAASGNASGSITVSTSAASGTPTDGDLWFQRAA